MKFKQKSGFEVLLVQDSYGGELCIEFLTPTTHHKGDYFVSVNGGPPVRLGPNKLRKLGKALLEHVGE